MITEGTEHVVKHIQEAIFAINLRGTITHWNTGAQNIFGYTQQELLGNALPFNKEETKKELEFAIKQFTQNQQTCLKTSKLNKTQTKIDVYVSIYPITNKQQLQGFVYVATPTRKIKSAVCLNKSGQTDTKRTFKQIRKIILFALTQGRMTINQVSLKTGINWKTVEKHLTFLIGKGYVEEVFSSEYVRIFELLPKGKTFVEALRQETISKIVQKEEQRNLEFQGA